MVRRRKGNIGVKILLAILAFIGVVFLLDKVAGTNILDTLYDKFVDFINWIAEKLGG